MLLFILIRENFASLYVCFNTSHVTLYRGMASTNGMERYVSIHLMLLFIYILPRNHLRMSVFQYISCYSLSSPFPPNLLYSKLVSIHLMLLFITSSQNIYYQYNPFQYISCYSLSVNILILFLLSLCFNTSHVTLYLIALQLVLDV